MELAILDGREEGEFSAAHLLWATPCPLSVAEFRAPALLPACDVRVVCTDGGEGLADRLATTLVGLGYTSVQVLDGGISAWGEAGYEVFSGFNVPSKAFGEWVEHHYGTPSIDAAELHAMQAAGADLLVVDSRPLSEFSNMSIPGAINVPGGELAYRVPSMLFRPQTTVVVNCAGRTRSILGAESLRQAGLPNRIMALRNGTMGWELAGFMCDRGRVDRYRGGVPADAADTLARARRFSEAHGAKRTDLAGLATLRADKARTTYVFDVRDQEEYEAGHLPGARSAPGGQLVQATDRWVAVANARIVLVDDHGTRAHMTAGWLRQLRGWDVYVIENTGAAALETISPPGLAPDVPCVTVDALQGWVADRSVTVVDIARSLAFRAGHIPGAVWGVRSRLHKLAADLPPERRVVVTAPDPELAALALAELHGLIPQPVAILQGGTAAWAARGLPLESSPGTPPDEACVDTWLRPYDRTSGIEEAMRNYLAWEIGLLRQIERDGDARFGQG
jgi:rhodanese-related sulfurtransferase